MAFLFRLGRPQLAWLAFPFVLMCLQTAGAFTDSLVPTDLCATSAQAFADDRTVLFAMSENRTVWYKHQLKVDNDAWSTWKPVGTGRKMRSGPSAIRFPDETIQVFARGYNDSKFYVSTMKSNTSSYRFSEWVPIGYNTFSSTPVAVVNPAGGVTIFGISNDTGTIWYAESTALGLGRGIFGPFADLGKEATSRPAVVLDPEGLIHVFVRGKDKALWHLSQSETNVTAQDTVTTLPLFDIDAWESLGGVLASSPSLPATLNGVGMVDVYGRASDKAIWHRSQAFTFVPKSAYQKALQLASETKSDSEWITWTTLGGVVASAPAVALDDAGLVHVFVRGADSGIYFKSQTATPTGGASYSGKWMSMGGMFTTTPTVRIRANGFVEVFTRGVDKALWHARQIGVNGSVPLFSKWESLGGHTIKYAC